MSRQSKSLSKSGFALKLEISCASAVEKWDKLTEPADVDEEVSAFVPRSEPQRQECQKMLMQACRAPARAPAACRIRAHGRSLCGCASATASLSPLPVLRPRPSPQLAPAVWPRRCSR